MNLLDEVKALRDEGYSEGELSVDPLWYILWEPENINQYNLDYELPRYAPEFTAFGSNGGGELLVVDDKGTVYSLPAIGMESQYANKIADSLSDLKKLMQK